MYTLQWSHFSSNIRLSVWTSWLGERNRRREKMAIPRQAMEIDSGEKRLNELGYKQELKREMVLLACLLTAFF